jgi:DNA helicase-2/ATP-dependent DNA helicase PcrA
VPSRFLEEVPPQLVENLSGRSPAWAVPAYTSSYGNGRRPTNESEERHYNYEDESQETQTSSRAAAGGRGSSKPFTASWMTGGTKSGQSGRDSDPKNKGAEPSIENIAHFFGGKSGAPKPGSFGRPAMDIPEPSGATSLKKGERVRHAKYGEGTVLMREGEGEDAKLTVLFQRHGMKKLMEKFANLEKI